MIKYINGTEYGEFYAEHFNSIAKKYPDVDRRVAAYLILINSNWTTEQAFETISKEVSNKVEAALDRYTAEIKQHEEEEKALSREYIVVSVKSNLGRRECGRCEYTFMEDDPAYIAPMSYHIYCKCCALEMSEYMTKEEESVSKYVRCINRGPYSYLTVGNIYEIIEEPGDDEFCNTYRIRNDVGVIISPYKSRFVEVEDIVYPYQNKFQEVDEIVGLNKFLDAEEKKKEEEKKCLCSLQDIMIRGCTCGQLQREKDKMSSKQS